MRRMKRQVNSETVEEVKRCEPKVQTVLLAERKPVRRKREQQALHLN